MRRSRNGLGCGAALLALGAVACGGTTGGNLIQIPFEAGGMPSGGTQPFMTIQGWTITLSAAQVVLGPLYFNIDAPIPSVYRSGIVIMQVPEQFIVDALDPALQPVPNGADGETGNAVSAEVGFFTTANGFNQTITLPAPLAADGQQGTAYIAGTATKGSVTINFAGRVQITTALVSGLNPIDQVSRVAGALALLDFTKTSGTLQLRVDPTRWFDQVDFCHLAGSTCAPAAGTVYDWDDTNPFNTQVLAGMGGTVAVYNFSLVP
jgi:hypothetical protein